MKNGNFLKSLIALSCVLTLGLGIFAGCATDKCEHVYSVTEEVPSTCTKHGSITSVCGICGDIKEEILPLDEDNHVLTGEWEITKPTEEGEGLAVKTCVNNPEHKVGVTLPKVTITGKGYDAKEFITVPTTARQGEMKLTLKNVNGDITFNVTLAERVLDNMEDAVILASSLQESVRSVTGTFKESIDSGEKTFSYYFGDDYTYIKDDANYKEAWYSLDDEDNVFAMSKVNGATTASVDPDTDRGYLNGFHYSSSVDVSTFYGAEQGLAKLYETAMSGMENGVTVNYKEISKDEFASHKALDGSLNDLWFSYSYDSGSWFTRFEVVFSTFRDGTLKKLSVQTEVIRSYMYVTDLDGSVVFYKEDDASVISGKAAVGDIIFAYDYPIDYETGFPAYEYEGENVVYEQTNKATGKVVYQKDGNYYEVTGGKKIDNNDGTYSYETYYSDALNYVPELEPVYIKDTYGMTVLDDKGNPIPKVMAKGGYPVDSYYSDTHSEVSYKTVTFTQTKKTDSDVVEPNPYPYDSLYIRDFDITGAKVGGVTTSIADGLIFPTNQVVTLSLGNITPSTASLRSDAIEKIYIKDSTGALIKLKDTDFSNGSQYKVLGFFSSSDRTVTLRSQYAGALTFVFETQSGKCKKEVEMTFTKSAPSALSAKASVYSVGTDGKAGYEDVVVSIDRPVSLIVGQKLTFWAVASGTEAAYVSTDIMPTSSEGVTFTQNEEGSYREWNLVATVAGEYTITMPYYDGTTSSAGVYAQFKIIVSDKPDVAQMLSGNTFTCNVLMAQSSGNPQSKAFTAEFTTELDENEETVNIIKINVGGVNGNDLVYTYYIDEEGNLVTEYKSGVAPTTKSYDFSFTINEAGDLVVMHGSGFGNDKEEIVLTKVVPSEEQN
ncbi:MAG: hypothetical protein ACI4MN_05495 [Candidatus Coproplasma sp.]